MVAVIFIPLLLVLFYLISPAYPWALCLLIAGLSMIAVHEVLWSTGFLKHTRISGYSIILAGLIPFWVYYDGRALPAPWGPVRCFSLQRPSQATSACLWRSWEAPFS